MMGPIYNDEERQVEESIEAWSRIVEIRRNGGKGWTAESLRAACAAEGERW